MPLQQLLADLLGDIRQPAILWRALAIVLCVAAGWAPLEREEKITPAMPILNAPLIST